MAELLLINPKKRKKARTAKQKAATKKLVAFNNAKRVKNPVKPLRVKPMKARRTAAQKRATKKLVSFNKSRSRLGKARKTTARRTRSTGARRNTGMAMYSPKKRARRTVVRRSPARRVVRRRNPSGRMNLQGQLMGAVQASLGALGLDLIWGYAPVPADWKMGTFRHLIKGAGAIGMGMVAKMVVSKSQADKLVHGALTVTMHDAIRELIAINAPDVQLGYYSPATVPGMAGSDRLSGMGSDRLGAYIGDSNTSPYLSPTNLSTPFAGPSAAMAVRGACPGVENEGNMGNWY